MFQKQDWRNKKQRETLSFFSFLFFFAPGRLWNKRRGISFTSRDLLSIRNCLAMRGNQVNFLEGSVLLHGLVVWWGASTTGHMEI